MIMSRFVTLTSLIAAGACLAAPAFAQTAAAPSTAAVPAAPVAPAATSPAPAAPAGTALTQTAAKPDRMVCEEEEVIGSRLGGHRVCKPASVWAQERRDAHDEIERAQTNRGVGGPNG
jgi:hypothetical protein